MHAQYFALINLKVKLKFCAKASFSLLLFLLGRGEMNEVVKRGIFTLTESEQKPVPCRVFCSDERITWFVDENLICILSREQNLSAG